MINDPYPLVYSTDPHRAEVCKKCRKLKGECRCHAQNSRQDTEKTAILRIEKSGRGGKTVTVIDRLPKHETMVKNLSRELKSRCGAGGTHKMLPTGGVIEIQGDKRDQLRGILAQQGFRVKG